MQIVTGRRGEPHVTSRQMQAVYRSFLGDFALLDIGEKLRAEAYSDDIVRVYDGVVSVQGIYAVIAYNQYDEVYIEPVSVGKKRIDTIVLHYTKDNALDVEDMQLDVVQGEEYTDNPIAPIVPEGGDAWEGTTDIQVPIYDVEVTNFGLTVIPHARMLTVIPTLDSIAERIPETVVTGVKGDSEVLYRDGNVNMTKANIGLGNVDNTADTDKPISTATQTALNLKADLTYVDAKISAAYHAGGNLTVADLTSALLIADNMGKVYNMSDSGVTTSDFVEGAGKSIREGDNVGICNVGTEESPVYKFDLLSGFVDLSAYATTSAVNTGLAGKVDKVTGKGLSTEDYTTTDKTKLAGISEGATQTIANPADTATETLSKLEVGGVVYDIPQGASGATELSELTDVNLTDVEDNDILQYDETANKWKNSNALQGSKTTTDTAPYLYKASSHNAVYDKLVGGSFAVNQLAKPVTYNGYGITVTNSNGILTINGTATEDNAYPILNDTEPSISGHKYYISFNNSNIPNGIIIYNDNNGIVITQEPDIQEAVGSGAWYIRIVGGTVCNNVKVTPQIIDLTLMFGSTIADYVYSLEQSSAGSGIAWLKSYGFFTKDYYPYNAGGLQSVKTSGKKVVGKNLFDTSDIVIGTIDSSGNNLDNLSSKRTNNYIKIIGGMTYVLSGLKLQIRLHQYRSDKSYIGNALQSNGNFTLDNDCSYIRIAGNAGWKSDTLMIRFATVTDSTYEPYTSTTYPLGNDELRGVPKLVSNQLVYDGDIKTSDGVISRRYGIVVFDGSSDENWNKNTADNNNWLYYVVNTNNVHVLGNSKALISNILPAKDTSEVVSSEGVSLNNGQGQIYYVNFMSAIGTNTVASLRTYLASHPLIVVYELATPTTETSTPFTSPQMVYSDGTEEYIDTRDVPIPVGGDREYIDIPEWMDNEYFDDLRNQVSKIDARPVLKVKSFSGTTDTDGAVTLIDASDIPSGHKIIPLQITDMTIGGSAGTYFVEYEPYNSGDSVKGYCYFYMSGSQMFPVGKAITGNFYYYELEG